MDENTTTSDDDEDDIPLSEWLNKRNLHYPNTYSVDDFINVDEEIQTTGILTEEEILQNFIDIKGSDEDDSESEEAETVNYAQARDALDILTRFYGTQTVNENVQTALSTLRRDMYSLKFNVPQKQTKLSDFFKKA